MPRLEDFVADIIQSRLVQRPDVEHALAVLPPGPESDAAVRLARALIRDDRLTSYQARKLLSGATRGFFLGGYRILQPLGAGGMGKVYLASREGDPVKVAIKVLPPRKAAEQENSVKRFQREMELSQRVRHPNLARTLGFGEEEGVHFMVMEYIPGESLFDLVKGEHGGRLRVPDVARLFAKVCGGLQAAHEVGIVHRDIKPSNIMVTPDGDVRVLDLGLARASGEEPSITRPNMVVGTLDYASPEQIVDASKADHRSDLYSLGCAIYFATAGRAPFEGGDLVNKIFKQRMDDPERLENTAPGVPPEFAAIVRKLMAKKPEDRYQSCQELRHDLVRWTGPVAADSPKDGTAGVSTRDRPPVAVPDDDIRLAFDDPGDPLGGPSIREFGDAEAAPAPRRKAKPVPVSAVVKTPERHPPAGGESRWLAHFLAVILILGLLAVLALTLAT